MPKFRKKPVVIEAEYLPDAPGTNNRRVVPRADAERILRVFPSLHPIGNNVEGEFEYLGFNIKTLEGIMFAAPGDWIIKGIKGELYPCQSDVFAATYDAVD